MIFFLLFFCFFLFGGGIFTLILLVEMQANSENGNVISLILVC